MLHTQTLSYYMVQDEYTLKVPTFSSSFSMREFSYALFIVSGKIY